MRGESRKKQEGEGQTGQKERTIVGREGEKEGWTDGQVGACYNLSFALLYADTSDCLRSFLPPSSHRASVLLRSYLADAIPSYCLLSCTIYI